MQQRFSLTYVLLHALYRLTGGESIILSNLYPLFFTTVVMAALYRLGRLTGDRASAWGAVALSLSCAPLVLLSQWVNLDMPVIAGYALAACFFVEWMKNHRWWALAAWAITCLLALLFKEYGGLIVPISVLIWMVWTGRSKVRLALAFVLAGCAAVVILLAPWLLKSIPALYGEFVFFPVVPQQDTGRHWSVLVWRLVKMQGHLFLLTGFLLPSIFAFVQWKNRAAAGAAAGAFLIIQLLTYALTDWTRPDYALFCPFEYHLPAALALAVAGFLLLAGVITRQLSFRAGRGALTALAWVVVILAAFSFVGRLSENVSLLDWRYTAGALPALALLAAMGIRCCWNSAGVKGRVLTALWAAVILFSNMAWSVCLSSYFNQYRESMAEGYRAVAATPAPLVLSSWPFYHGGNRDIGRLSWQSDGIEVKSARYPQHWTPEGAILVMNEVAPTVVRRLPYLRLLWGRGNQVRMVHLMDFPSPVKYGDEVLALAQTPKSRAAENRSQPLPKDFFPYRITSPVDGIESKNNRLNLHIRVKNLGSRVWPSKGDHAVCVAGRLIDSEGRLLQGDLGFRLQLPCRLLPNQEVPIDEELKINLPEGKYQLFLHLGFPSQGPWFSDIHPEGALKIPLVVSGGKN
jgi:4-amino-4-deoxy-L-arabinose transferase-like glycosyltransferase